MIKAIIFDLDGTILDSIDAMWQAFNTGLAAYNLEPMAKEPLLRAISRGISLSETLRDTYPALRTEAASSLIEGIMTEVRKDYLVRVTDEVQLMNGAQQLLSSLRTRGLKIGIVTNRRITPEGLWHELERLEVAQFIDVVITGVEGKRKPEPDAIIECLKRLQLLPEEAILVGDAELDIIAGRAAGMVTVAIATGVVPRETLLGESPDFVFDDLPAFMDKLDFILSRKISRRVVMEKAEYQQLFLFAAKAGALEGYLFKRRKVEPLTNWVRNISEMYRDLSPVVKKEIDPVLASVIERALKYGKRVLEPALREELEQILLETKEAS